MPWVHHKPCMLAVLYSSCEWVFDPHALCCRMPHGVASNVFLIFQKHGFVWLWLFCRRPGTPTPLSLVPLPLGAGGDRRDCGGQCAAGGPHDGGHRRPPPRQPCHRRPVPRTPRPPESAAPPLWFVVSSFSLFSSHRCGGGPPRRGGGRGQRAHSGKRSSRQTRRPLNPARFCCQFFVCLFPVVSFLVCGFWGLMSQNRPQLSALHFTDLQRHF